MLIPMVDRGMRLSTDPVGRLLNARAFAATGVLSYSLYLWQQPFLASHQTGWWTVLPLSVVLVVLAALVSYVLIERPFLALRQFVDRPHFVRVAAVFPWTTRPPE